MVLVSSVGKGLDSKSFQLALLIVRVRVQAGAECAKIAYSMRVQIAQARVAPNVGCNKPFDPGSPGSDLNPVIRSDSMCSVKCAEAAGNYKSGSLGIVHYKSHAFIITTISLT